MSGAIFNDDTGYPAPQALREGFKARYIAPMDMPASTRCWHISLPDDPQVTAAMHEILGILRGEAVWSGDNATPIAALISNTLHEECKVNTLQYTVIEATTNSDTPAMDMIPSNKLTGSKFFAPFWGFRVGDVLHGIYKFRLSNTPNVTRTAFLNATFAGAAIGGGAFSIPAPQLENAHIELETIATITNYSLDGATQRMKFDVVTWAQAMIFRPNQELQRHNVGRNALSFFEDTQAVSGLGTSWNAVGGSITLDSGFLEVKRVG